MFSRCSRVLFKYTLYVLVLLANSSYAASEQELVEGLSEFLIERANANLMAVYERRLKKNEDFQCYFPNTFEKIKSISIQGLFTSKEFWKESLEEDLEALVYRAALVEISKAYYSKGNADNSNTVDTEKVSGNVVVRKLYDRYTGFLQLVSYEDPKSQVPYSLTSLPLDRTLAIVPIVNGFFDPLNNGRKDLITLMDMFVKAEKVKDICDIKLEKLDDIKKALLSYKNLLKLHEHFKKHSSNIAFNSNVDLEKYCSQIGSPSSCSESSPEELLNKMLLSVGGGGLLNVTNKLEGLLDFIGSLKSANKKQLTQVDLVQVLLPLLKNSGNGVQIKSILVKFSAFKKKDKTQQTKILIDVLASVKALNIKDEDATAIKALLRELITDQRSAIDRALLALNAIEKSGVLTENKFNRLNRAVIFFASISDAKSKDAVKSIIEANVLPAVSFSEKRKPGSGVFLSSYFGVATSDTDEGNSVGEAVDVGGLYVPIGIEYNYAWGSGWSLSGMASPIDMSYPINVELSSETVDAEFKHILSPSLSLAIGAPDLPLNFGIAFQKGKSFVNDNRAEEKILLFISFDMPLLRLY